MRSLTVGHLVLADDQPTMQSASKETKGVLFVGARPATLFKTRKAALNAINTTINYATKQGYTWAHKEYRIVRVGWAKP